MLVVGTLAMSAMPVAAGTGHTVFPQAQGTNTTAEVPFAYIVGNTSVTEGYPAYDGPGASQGQSMPQYILVIMSAPPGMHANVSIGGRSYDSNINLTSNPQVVPVYTNATGTTGIVVTFYGHNETRVDAFSVQFMLVAQFIHYEQGLHPSSVPVGVSEASLGVDIVWAFAIVVVGFVARHGIVRLRWMRKTIDNFFR